MGAMLDIDRRPLGEFTEQAYLDYSMYVILDRALPHIGDIGSVTPKVQKRMLKLFNQAATAYQAQIAELQKGEHARLKIEYIICARVAGLVRMFC